MKKYLLIILSAFMLFTTAGAQTMKVYRDGQLKAIYYVLKGDRVEFSPDFPFPDNGDKDEPTSQIPIGKAVDLGLSVKWADINIGAEKPEDAGWYLAWGETKPKDEYSWGTYFDTKDGGNTFFKYSTDTKRELDPEDDAAHVNWGGDWRMPSQDDLDELHEKCTWTWTTQNGVNGFKLTSNVNGNSIFLPAAGRCLNSSLESVGSIGFYWLSLEKETLDSNYAYINIFRSNYIYWSGYDYRYIGFPVRAVCP